MSEVCTNRSGNDGGSGAGDEGNPREARRIRIDVPMGTPYLEIQAAIFRQVYQYAGTQLRAAIALGITPDTVSRILRRSERRQFAADSAASPEPMAEEKQPCGQPRTAEPLARAVGQIERARERAMRSERKLFAAESPYLEDSDPSLDSVDQEALMTDD